MRHPYPTEDEPAIDPVSLGSFKALTALVLGVAGGILLRLTLRTLGF